MYTWSFIVCGEITNICYNPRLLLEFQKLCVWFSCLPQHFKYRLKCLLNWRPEQQRAAGLEKEVRKCKHSETCYVDNKSTAQPNYHDYLWTLLHFIVSYTMNCDKIQLWLKTTSKSQNDGWKILSSFTCKCCVFWDRVEHYKIRQAA